MDLELDLHGARLPAELTVPHGPALGGCVALHPAGDGSRSQPLLRHLARVLPEHGVAVLLHDRRPTPDAEDLPLAVQASDALAVAEVLRSHVGPVPIGLWGWSQGAWAAALAATSDTTVAFLVLIASVGVSPAAQMRHGTAELLRRHGFGEDAVAQLLHARATYEQALRGRAGRDAAQRALDRIAAAPWRQHAWLPERITPDTRWPDMDFDPAPVFAAARCPTLVVWGEDDPWVPVDDSEAVWRRAAADHLSVLRLADVGHGPEPGDQRYEQALLQHVLSAVAR